MRVARDVSDGERKEEEDGLGSRGQSSWVSSWVLKVKEKGIKWHAM